MSLRLRGMIARSKHRAAYVSVETETQFGPGSVRNNVPRLSAGLSVAASDPLAVQSRDEAAARLSRKLVLP